LFLKSPPELILASTSRYRRALLARVHESFECEAPGVDETRREHEGALALVARLALGKAHAVAARHTEAWVIGSDQAAVLKSRDGEEEIVLGKPGTAERCAETLRSCSGATVTYCTAVAVVRASDASAYEFVDTTRVKFRELDEATIARYIARESPLDCAGGFKSEGLGISLCEAIESEDPSALIGLPLIRLCSVLRRVGYQTP
jgi:septum formation protein